ncbi:1-phosphofructokinase [Bacillus alkalicellulosilyticus]|uniref:1-phosphofructokinase n=1 Tax=Alkalihalobacterium alkalicellulosilyticum TaxID=1912214 RepID=UPI00099665B3|nr:1-phosphofructokinase [Bacillus alkalicellulosilyticus]
MIYTVTINPSIDYIIKSNVFLGQLNRSEEESKQPGGKGINVSRVLHRLGVSSIATGFIGGFTGAFIKNSLQNEGVEINFIEVAGDTRINIKIKGEFETEINGSSPLIPEESIERLLENLEVLTQEDILVLAGSIPSSLPSTIYSSLIEVAKRKNTKIVLDTSGSAFKDALKENLFFIKPNHHELGELFGVQIETVEQAIPYAKQLVNQGIDNIVVSFAEKGALFVNKKHTFVANVPKGQVKNSVGAGDSVVAGFLANYLQTKHVKSAFQYGVAAGSASAFSDGFCSKEEVEVLQQQISIVEQ